MADIGVYDKFISDASKAYGVPFDMIKSVIDKESSFNQFAVGKVGEEGLMQLTPKYYPDVARFDAESNIHAGTKALADNFKRFGNWSDALAAYNGGFGGMKSGQAQSYARDVIDRFLKRGGALDKGYDANTSFKAEDVGARAMRDAKNDAALEADKQSVKDIISDWFTGKSDSADLFKGLARKTGLWVLAVLLLGLGVWKLING